MAQKCLSCGSPAYLGLSVIECENPLCLHYKAILPKVLLKDENDEDRTPTIPGIIVASTPRWLSLHVAAPVTLQNEISYGGYCRVEIDQGQVMKRHSINNGGRVHFSLMNDMDISFPMCLGGGGMVNRIGYWDKNGLISESDMTFGPMMVNWGSTPVLMRNDLYFIVP